MAWAAIGAIGAGYLMGEANKSAASSAADAQKEAAAKSAQAQAGMNEAQLAQVLAQVRAKASGEQQGLKRGQTLYGRGKSDFLKETTGTPKAIKQLQDLIRKGATKEQQQSLGRGKLALSQAGVRGPEAALMSQMQSNELSENLARAVQDVSLKQSLMDRARRQNFAQQEAMTGMGKTMQNVTDMSQLTDKSIASARRAGQEADKSNYVQAYIDKKTAQYNRENRSAKDKADLLKRDRFEAVEKWAQKAKEF